MKTDKYGEVINDPETYVFIVKILLLSTCCLIGWTDEVGAHYDILFTKKLHGPVPTFGTIQGGVSGTDLFVSIMRVGAFGFDIKNSDTSWNYYDEKLRGNFGETTGKKLAELINGVKKELVKIYG